MFKKIRKMSVKVTNFCNLDCVYCHQLRKDKDNTDSFRLYDELEDFLRRCTFAERVPVTVAGGEISLRPREFEECVRRFSSMEFATFTPNIVTNGSNIKNVLKQIRKGYIRPDAVNVSWDGIHSYSKTRHGKKNIYSDAFFNSNLHTLASLGFGRSICLMCAVTPYNVGDMYDSLMYALGEGMRNFYFYLIHEASYENEDFLKEFQKQEELVADEFVKRYDTEDRFMLYNYQNLYTRVAGSHDFLSDITCKKLGSALHFDMEGDIYPCLYFGDHRAFQIGNLLDGGIYLDRIEEFSDKFLRRPSCLEKHCGLRNCFECPASDYISYGEMQERRCNGCAVRAIEAEIFGKVMSRIHISDYDKHAFWHDEDSLSHDHMLHRSFEPDKLGVPLASSKAHKKPMRRIASETEKRVSTWL